MKNAVYCAAILALLAIAWCFGVAGYQACYLPPRVGEDLQTRADALQETVEAARRDLDRTERGLVGQTALMNAQLGNIAVRADTRLESIQVDASQQIARAVTRVDARLGEGIAELGRLRADFRPVLASTDELLQQTSGTVAVLRPQLLGLTAAGKRMAGESAQAAIRFDAALPEFITIGQKFGRSSTATANNIERITRPDKWWLTGAKIAAPAFGSFAWGWAKGK